MAVDYFLKFEGPAIDGESTDDKHKNEIDVLSWSWGESQQGTRGAGGGGGAGKVSMQDAHFTKASDKATPKLMLACADGQHIKKATLTCRKAGGEQQEFLIITLSDVLVSGYQISGSRGDVVPMEQVSLNYAKIELSYKPQKADGSLDAAVKAGYDLALNKKI